MNKITEKIKNDKILNLIKRHVKNADVYLVGGALRDFFQDKENFDKDLIIDKADAKKFAQSLAKSIDATFIPLDEENKIYRLILKDKVNCIDIANLIGKNIEEDLKRRDLTINAIAINLKTLEILDFTEGIKDLKSKKIRHINEQNFVDDPLRLLRVYRFQATLGFDVDNELSEIVAKHASKIRQTAVERINYELLKLFSGDYSAKTLTDMDKTGLLKEILPISQELKKVPPNLHHHLNLFEHSIEIVRQIEEIYKKSNPEVQEHLQKTDFSGASRLAHLKLAGFLHDIGKPDTWTIEEDTGKHRFIKHDDIGSKIGIKLLKSAKFSKKQTDYIVKMIKYHIYPSHVVRNPEINEKVYMRLIRKMGNEVIDVIILAMADRLSARGIEITDEIIAKNINNLQLLLDFYLSVKDSLKPLPKLLSGYEIMELLNIKPSKELGEIVNALKEAQLSGEITTKKEAERFVETKRQA
ncbi:MAG: HD domain-containing protein [Candidatus Gastranaerophilales bacterium]|nr:HD domain-containing protein [Candidatus Gastranaerophilales bacterium]